MVIALTAKKENFILTLPWQHYIFGKFDVLEESHFPVAIADLHERERTLVIATQLTKFLMLRYFWWLQFNSKISRKGHSVISAPNCKETVGRERVYCEQMG